VYGSWHERIRSCSNCGLVLAMHPLRAGFRLIPLEDAAREAVLRASQLPANPPFSQLLRAAVDHRSYPANVMVGALLALHPDVEQKLADALSCEDFPVRQAAIEFVAQLPHVSERLEQATLRVARAQLEASGPGEEPRWMLEALLAVARRVATLSSDVRALARALRGCDLPPPDQTRSVALSLLAQMEDQSTKMLAERDAALAVLRRLAKVKDYEQAEAWIRSWAQDYREDHQLPSRALLAEEAGDGLTQNSLRAARWLYERSLRLLEEHASWSSVGEGPARGWQVLRVSQKLTVMDQQLRQSMQERETGLAMLRRMVIDKRYEDAEEWVIEWAGAHPEGSEVLTRATIVEEAGDGVTRTDRAAAQWLYEKAMRFYEEYASTWSPGKSDVPGVSEGRHQRRVRRKLTDLMVLWKQED
jgi:hypothetical protein